MLSIQDEVLQAIALARERALNREMARFAARAAALELLEVHVFDRLRFLAEQGALPSDLEEARASADALRARLEARNEMLVERLRARIAAGRFMAHGLKRAFARMGPPGRDGDYDWLDLLVTRLLEAGPLEDEREVRDPEMVWYQPTPARAILALVERAQLGPDDTLYDLGSGLGRVVILAAMLSGARAKGVEFEPTFHAYAERSASLLNVAGVELIHADARQAAIDDGTVYFLFTPFRGAMLRQVLERIREVAKLRAIRVCTFGPCTAEVSSVSWLKPGPGAGLGEHEVAVFHSIR